MLDVRRLQFLVELDRRGTIAAVAQALHMSPSGISQQLSLLEREAGTPLLERVGRRVRLTEAGQTLAEHGADILAALEAAQTQLHSGKQIAAGKCRVAAFGSAARALVPSLIECQQQHPGLRVELVEAEPEAAIPALLSGDCDIVVSEEYPGPRLGTPRHLHREVLALDQLDLVASADLLKGQDPLKAAEHLPWALEPVDSASREWAEQHCRNLGFTPMVQYESLDLELLLLLVKQSAAVSILPALVLAAEGSNSSIVRVETGWARTLVLLTRRARREDPSVLAVSSALRRRFHDSSVSLTE